MSFWILSKAYQTSISPPFLYDSKDICTFWWWWYSQFYIKLLLIASTLNYGSLLLLASHFLSYAHQVEYFITACNLLYQPHLLLPQGSKGSPRHCLAGQPRPYFLVGLLCFSLFWLPDWLWISWNRRCSFIQSKLCSWHAESKATQSVPRDSSSFMHHPKNQGHCQRFDF